MKVNSLRWKIKYSRYNVVNYIKYLRNKKLHEKAMKINEKYN